MGTRKNQPDPLLEVIKPPRRLTEFRKLPSRGGNKIPSNGVLTTLNLERLERRYQIIELRRIGYHIYEIAEMLKVSPVTVRADLQKVMELTATELQESTVEYRILEAERLDDLQKAYYLAATQPLVDTDGNIIPENIQSAVLVLKIMERRAKLLGLDKPEAKNEEQSAVREYIGVDMAKV